MNSNYRRHKSSNLHFQRQQKITSKANPNLKNRLHYDDLLSEAKKYYHQQKDLLKAIKGFQEYLEIFPHHDESTYLCGVCLMQLQYFQNAVSKFERVSDNYCLKQNALLLASMAFNKMGNLTKSYSLVNQSIRTDPLFQEAVCFRAKLNIQMDNYLKAQSDFKNAVKINPHSYIGLIGLGDCRRYFNRYQQAIDYYSKSLKEISKQHSSREIIDTQIKLKIGTCYYSLQRYKQCIDTLKQLQLNQKMGCSQLYFYYGLCQLKLNNRQKGVNHLEYSIRLDSNPIIVEKAYKKLILSYLQNCQFYEAQTMAKMGILYNIKAKQWQELIGICMLAIKSHYKEALQGLNKIYNILKEHKPSASVLKIDKEENPISKVIVSSNRYSNLFKKKSVKQSSRYKKSPNSKQKLPFLTKIKRSFDKVQSMRINTNINHHQSFPLKLTRYKTQYKQGPQKPVSPFTQKQRQVVYPIVLQFKAYCQFFNYQVQSCIDTFEEYQSYILNHFGKESNIKYSKYLCQIFLLIQADEPEEALIKCNESIDLHLQKYGNEPIQPLLYKICILIKMAMSFVLNEDQSCKAESKQILLSTLEMIYSKSILHNCPIAQYYTTIIFILLEDYQKAKECIQSAVKLSDECTANMFYSKAILEMKMGYYITAFKDITASILLKKTSRAYLVRCLILLRVSEEKQALRKEVLNLINVSLKTDSKLQGDLQVNSVNAKYMREYIKQKCLDELQNYIQLCRQDEDQITIWVTKVLFACKSYDEALLSFDKVKLQYHKDIFKITQCLSIYSGDFEKGGRVGIIIKQSFDANFLNSQQQQSILKGRPIKDYSSPEFDYLDQSYEKWLIILHLYMKQQYSLCIQYIQMLIKQPKQEQTQFLLRYDLAILYFILNDHTNACKMIQTLFKFESIYNVKPTIQRILQCRFVNDECLNDLSSQLFIRSLKMLSNYLSYKSIYLTNNHKQVKVYARINIPFPSFYKPDLSIEFEVGYILSQLNIAHIPKRIEAPWIKRVNNSIQFTEQLDNTMISFDSKPNEETSNNLNQLQHQQSRHSVI